MKIITVEKKKEKLNSDDSSGDDTDEFRNKQKQRLIEENLGELMHQDKWYIIKESNIYYQQWKIFMIFMNFVSSFGYAYYSTFMEYLNDDQMSTFFYFDTFFDYLFVF
jgi:hypothetical protein